MSTAEPTGRGGALDQWQVADTARLSLRRLTAADAPFILELVNEPGWLAHIGDRQVHDLSAAAAYIVNGPLASHARHGFGLDLVSRKNTGEAIGLCGLLQRDYLDAPDIGYALLQRHQGLGFASEVAATVLTHAQQALGLTRLYALTSLDNAGSIRVLEKTGFRFERILRAPGFDEDSRLFLREV